MRLQRFITVISIAVLLAYPATSFANDPSFDEAKRGAQDGYAEPQFLLGKVYIRLFYKMPNIKKPWPEPDRRKGLYWLCKASKNGSEDAEFVLISLSRHARFVYKRWNLASIEQFSGVDEAFLEKLSEGAGKIEDGTAQCGTLRQK